jgi:hypothetical protein
MKLETLTSRQIRWVLAITYSTALLGVITTALTNESVDDVVEKAFLIPLLVVGYSVFVYKFLSLCCWECVGLPMREQAWVLATLTIGCGCAIEVTLFCLKHNKASLTLALNPRFSPTRSRVDRPQTRAVW